MGKLYDCISMADLRSKAKKPEKNPRFARESSLVTCSIQLARATTVDTFKGVAQMGRFTLRDENKTIAIGKITELPTKEGSEPVAQDASFGEGSPQEADSMKLLIPDRFQQQSGSRAA